MTTAPHLQPPNQLSDSDRATCHQGAATATLPPPLSNSSLSFWTEAGERFQDLLGHFRILRGKHRGNMLQCSVHYPKLDGIKAS